MSDARQHVYSMTAFKRNSSLLLKRMKKTKRPLVLTVKGKVEFVILDLTVYPLLADHLDAVASIRLGLAQANQGLGRLFEDVFDDLERQP